ncbi:hypothetical protein DLAC_01728 [Tieghemostelium lacteum]|uniref:FNIP repeat-containing protein n=1 Tax=Tieghemostelium lacteum TaxID=361077 RepID=A0A152A670_TIELA|nr:hypothetical protein DLAC_01728 [Tieghemostelium lacteum]|eukprot:KYR01718.1 hypothetical protein DLAC_01728 [Tieghemostelium lacteum]
MIILPLTVLKIVNEHLKTNQDIIYFLSTCKSLYQFKNNLIYRNFPINWFWELKSSQSRLSKITSIFSTKKSKLKDYGILPKRYEILKIDNKEFYQIYLDEIKYLEDIEIGNIDIGYYIGDKPYSLQGTLTPILFPKNTLTTLVLGTVHPQSLHNLMRGSLDDDSHTKPLPSEILQPGIIPPTVVSLTLGSNLDFKLVPGTLPPSIRHLAILYKFSYDEFQWDKIIPRQLQTLKLEDCNRILQVGDLQEPLETLKLNGFNQVLTPGVLPSTLRYLDLGDKFQKPLETCSLPSGLEILSLVIPGYKFTSTSQHLPRSLKSLSIYTIDLYSIPPSLTKLSLRGFDQPITPLSLPPTLKTLEFSFRHNYPLEKDSLPEGLERLVLSKEFNQPIKIGDLPSTLKYLSFGYKFQSDIDNGSLPASLESLHFSGIHQPTILIGSLTHLVNLVALTLPCPKYIEPNALPDQIVSLTISIYLNSNLVKGSLPLYLKDLYIISESSNYVLDTQFLPPNLTKLALHNILSFTGPFPETLLELQLGHPFNETLQPGQLPPKLNTLKFSVFYQKALPTSSVPSTLRHLHFPHFQKHLLKDCKLPPYCSVHWIKYNK